MICSMLPDDRPPIEDASQLCDALEAMLEAQGRTWAEVLRTAGGMSSSTRYFLKRPTATARQETWVRLARALGCRWALVPDVKVVKVTLDRPEVYRRVPKRKASPESQ